jgi:hypothetical protein
MHVVKEEERQSNIDEQKKILVAYPTSRHLGITTNY